MSLECDARSGGELLTSLHYTGPQITAKTHRGSTEGRDYRRQGLAWPRLASVAVGIGCVFTSVKSKAGRAEARSRFIL